jgi:hypothetical protein
MIDKIEVHVFWDVMCSFVDRYSVSKEPYTLKMETTDASRMFVPVYQTTGRHIPEDSTISILETECYNSVEV